MTLWTYLWLLGALLPGTQSQIQLVQSGPEIKKPGESVRFTCKASGYTFNQYSLNWIRQAPGKGLEWVGRIRTDNFDTFYPESLKTRVTITVDVSISTLYLQLTDLKIEDTAVYYCARHSSSGYAYFDLWGQGIFVTVTSATPTAPTVFPLCPCHQDLSTVSEVTIGCLVTGYFPEPVTVQWNSGAISTGIRTFPAMMLSSSGHYTLSSQLTIPISRWESGNFQCNVDHTATRSKINKQVERGSSCKTTGTTPVAPVVSLLHSSCNSQSSDALIQMVCLVKGFSPKEVIVEWLSGDQTGLLSSYTEEPRKDENGHTFSTISTANISQSDWQDGAAVTCQVTHPATSTKVKSTAKKCEGSSSDIRVFIRRPDPNDVFLERRPKLTCVINNLQSDHGLVVSWSREKSGQLVVEPIEVKDEVNGTLTAFSKLILFDQEWLSGETFTCSVKHPDLLLPKTARISKKQETATAPKLYLYRPHHEELISNGRHVSVTAMVKGFKPNEISLSWLKGNEPLPEDDFVTSPVLRDSDGTYVQFSKLKVLKSEWNRGDSFSCMVVHEGLRMKFIQKNIEKSLVTIMSMEIDESHEGDEIESLWTTLLIFFILFLLSVCYSASVTMFKVKWLFSMVVQLKKQPSGPEYKNVLHHAM